MSWSWSRSKSTGPSDITGICPHGHLVRREGSALRVLWWFLFGLGDCPDCLERQLAEAQRILALDDSRLLTAVENTARALKERDEAQGKLEAVEIWNKATHCCQYCAKRWLDRIVKGE